MTTQPDEIKDEQPEETVAEEVAEESAAEPLFKDEEEEYEPPLNGQEFRETVSEGYEYVKEAWLQPFRKVVRDGLDATRDFARDLSGKKRRK